MKEQFFIKFDPNFKPPPMSVGMQALLGYAKYDGRSN